MHTAILKALVLVPKAAEAECIASYSLGGVQQSGWGGLPLGGGEGLRLGLGVSAVGDGTVGQWGRAHHDGLH